MKTCIFYSAYGYNEEKYKISYINGVVERNEFKAFEDYDSITEFILSRATQSNPNVVSVHIITLNQI